MGERLADTLLAAAAVLRWFGKYTESNALILISRLLRVHDIDDLDKLENFVTAAEEASAPTIPADGGRVG